MARIQQLRKVLHNATIANEPVTFTSLNKTLDIPDEETSNCRTIKITHVLPTTLKERKD